MHPAFAWSGFTSAFASIVIGNRLQAELGTFDALFAVVLGNWILFIYSAAIGYAAGRWGLNSQLVLEAVFGRSGALLPGLVLAFLVTGWFAYHVVLTVAILGQAFHVNEMTPLWLGTIGLVFAAPLLLGLSRGFNLTALAFPAMLLFVSIVSYRYIAPKWAVLLDGPLHGTLPFGTGVCITFGIFVVSGTMTGDIVRYCQTGNQAIQATAVGFLVSNLPFLVVGVLVGAIHLTASDLLLSSRPISFLLLSLALVAHWTTCDACLENASVTIKSAFPGLPWIGACCGALGVGMAIAFSGLVGDVFEWLLLLVTVVAPIGGIILADYYILRANKGFAHARTARVNVAALSALVATVIGIRFWGSSVSDWASPLVGVPMASLVYLVLVAVMPVGLGTSLGSETLGAEAVD